MKALALHLLAGAALVAAASAALPSGARCAELPSFWLVELQAGPIADVVSQYATADACQAEAMVRQRSAIGLFLACVPLNEAAERDLSAYVTAAYRDDPTGLAAAIVRESNE